LSFTDGSFSDKIINELNKILSIPLEDVINDTFAAFMDVFVMPKVSKLVDQAWTIVDTGILKLDPITQNLSTPSNFNSFSTTNSITTGISDPSTIQLMDIRKTVNFLSK